VLLAVLKLLVLAAGAIVLPAILLFNRRSRKWGVAYLAAYLGVYLLLSLQGQYVARDLSGGWGSAGGPPQIAYYWWCPLKCGTAFGIDKHTGREIKERNATAAFFWPLLLVDRTFLHRDEPPRPDET
jgi:hypothetical protein